MKSVGKIPITKSDSLGGLKPISRLKNKREEITISQILEDKQRNLMKNYMPANLIA